MKTIQINETNINRVAGLLRKFIGVNREFKIWHQWTGGMRKRLPHFITVDNDLKIYDPEADKVELDVMYPGFNMEMMTPDDYSIIIYWDDDYDQTNAITLTYGDKISFLGNRIVTRTPSPIPKYKYVYECIQITK